MESLLKAVVYICVALAAAYFILRGKKQENNSMDIKILLIMANDLRKELFKAESNGFEVSSHLKNEAMQIIADAQELIKLNASVSNAWKIRELVKKSHQKITKVEIQLDRILKAENPAYKRKFNLIA